MIETMKVVTLVASSKKKNEMLTSLRDAGLLHIKELKKTCEASEQKAQRIHSLMTVLNAISDEGDRKKEVKQENLDSDSFSRLHEEIMSGWPVKSAESLPGVILTPLKSERCAVRVSIFPSIRLMRKLWTG